MVTQWNIIHGDLSPNNSIIHNRKGYFNFDHAKFLKNNAVVNSHDTVSYISIHSLCIHILYASTLKGTVPYISCCLLKLMGDVPHPSMINHRASDDLESLFYILLKFPTMYEGPSGKASVEGVHPLNAPRWCKAYLMMDGDGIRTSGSLKKEFLTEKHPPYEPIPCFRACCPILEEWTEELSSKPRHSKQKNWK